MNEPPSPRPENASLIEAMDAVFESLGRGLICLSKDLHVVHASKGLDRLVEEGTAESMVDQPIQEILGEELFGPQGTLRLALERGEKREGWGVTITRRDGIPQLLSLSVAPLDPELASFCNPQVAYIAVLRPSQRPSTGDADIPTLFAGMVARSSRMRQIFRLIQNLGESDATVLVTGESGTGKEMVARAIHLHSARRNGPFIAVNCGALPGELLESELFGHVRGAFTGAVRDRIGRFEAANGGTIFLDEIGDLPLPLQVKLLRVLQEHTFDRVGETATRKTDARVIAATNQDLRAAVLEGQFRDDLYYRLRVVPLDVPPLRQRREDVEPLAEHLLNRVNRRHHRDLRLSPQAMRALLRYTWPGNVRELENALEYALAVTRGQTIHVKDLPVEVIGIFAGEEPDEMSIAGSAAASRDESAPAMTTRPDEIEPAADRDRILAALQANRWRRDATASALGISRTTLWRKMREYQLHR